MRANSPEAFGLAAFFVGVATLVRWGVMTMGIDSPLVFSTYFPAVLLAMLIGGARAAMLATGLGGAIAYAVFLPHERLLPPTLPNSAHLTLFLVANLVMIWILDRFQRRVSRLREEDARHLTLAREHQHRVKNALFVVETIVRQSLGADPRLAQTINQRIRGGLASVDISYGSSPQPVGAAALLTRQLEPFGLERFDLQADQSRFKSNAQSIVALAVHELATNAVKYGSLSMAGGRVSVCFGVADRRATLSWREFGGPPVREPKRRGYGSVLLRRLVEAAGGSIKVDFRREGLAAEISLPANRLH